MRSLMERRLNQPPLAQVVFAFAREETVPEQLARPLETAALPEVPLVRDEDVLHHLWMAERDDVLACGGDVHDVAVGACEIPEIGQRLASQSERKHGARRATGTGRPAVPGHVSPARRPRRARAAHATRARDRSSRKDRAPRTVRRQPTFPTRKTKIAPFGFSPTAPAMTTSPRSCASRTRRRCSPRNGVRRFA